MYLQEMQQKLERIVGTVRSIEWVHLLSTGGGPPQDAHLDYDPDKVYGDGEPKPYFGIISLEKGSRLDVFPGSHKMMEFIAKANATEPFAEGTTTSRTCVNLEVGSCILCHHLLAHGGAAYLEDNRRLHAYLDVDADADHKGTFWLQQWLDAGHLKSFGL